ncbi:capsule biosynthesis protein [Ignatzschineria sp. LJL83]
MKSFWDEFIVGSKRVLLLQGPIGPFFQLLQEYLTQKEHKIVFKINFNGGDEYYYPASPHTISYQGSPRNFSEYLHRYVQEHNIDAIVCFGDGRKYHRIAKEYCELSKRPISFWAFEEGYLRPNYVTFEKWGVNFNSTLSRDKFFYQQDFIETIPDGMPLSENEPRQPHIMRERPLTVRFFSRAKMASRYYFEMWKKRKTYALYRHHRETKLRVYFGAWLKTGILKYFYKLRDRPIAKLIRQQKLDNFFIFPLQVHNDNQIIRHGRGLSMPEYIRKVINSFSENAPSDSKLIIKHHPMDRGFSNYQSLIVRLATRKGVLDRVLYVHEISMPDLLRNAKAMVVINSTCGISALIHGLPIKVIGDAHYDIEGLTSHQSLKKFWKNPHNPNPENIKRYLKLLRGKTQLNGSFYNPYRLNITEFQEIPEED